MHSTHSPSSQSSVSMAEKSALPTPTIMMDMGSLEARTIARMVSGMSEITPSVNINRIKYCCRRMLQTVIVHALTHIYSHSCSNRKGMHCVFPAHESVNHISVQESLAPPVPYARYINS